MDVQLKQHHRLARNNQNLLDGKVHDRRVLVNEESVLGEAFDVENDELRQSGDLESLHEVVLV